ncbi:hypothetical protein PGTUg99_026825 [Puccinia graminis f. sp. tritici]|uniref:Uncharacterized protein n=1 Tax=Puccinia graminis f. sp. tritici TaxID=56615 RepID=A0A5B0QUJ3_PUCGR|nr:hypothetical protein PGTUg99_026825 [Puccinia graminis f. sp. tritici]
MTTIPLMTPNLRLTLAQQHQMIKIKLNHPLQEVVLRVGPKKKSGPGAMTVCKSKKCW